MNICIVSGLARGVDTYAHYYSKDKEGKTIAIIASGFNNIYPKENITLFNSILSEGGCIISEWEPNTKVEMNRFPRRNRIISGISVGTLVIEAKYRSGTSITAHNAIKQKRELFCIPGNIDSINSYGTNKFISEGATIVTSPKDILEVLEYNGLFIDKKMVEPEYSEIYKFISDIPISADEISRKLHEDIKTVNQKLLMLEIDGFIKADRKGGFVLNDNQQLEF